MGKYIITVLGKDRPGIIASVSKVLYELDCKIENVNQMILQSEFASFFIIRPPKSIDSRDLKTEIDKQIADKSLYIHVKEIEKEDETQVLEVEKGEPFIISATGPDQKGLVAKISGIIAEYNANIVNLEAVFKGGEDPGNNIMSFEVFITEDIDRETLIGKLKAKADELNLDIRIQHKNIFNTINKI